MSANSSKPLPTSGYRLDEEEVGLCANLNSLDMVAQMTDKSPVGKAGAVQNQWHLQ